MAQGCDLFLWNMARQYTTVVCCGAVVTAFLMAGCASPDYRIKKYPDLFNQYPEGVREKIANGEIEVGFEKDAVYLALGQPRRTYRKRSESQDQEIWIYTDLYVRHHFASGHYSDCGRYRDYQNPVIRTYHHRDRVQVVFEEDCVVVIISLEEDQLN